MVHSDFWVLSLIFTVLCMGDWHAFVKENGIMLRGQWLQPLGQQLSARHPHPNTASINTSQQCMLNVLRAEPWGCSQPGWQWPVETECDVKLKNSLIIRTWGTHVSSILTLTLLSTPSIKSSHRVWIILYSTSCSACYSSSKARVMCSQTDADKSGSLSRVLMHRNELWQDIYTTSLIQSLSLQNDR